MTYIHDVYLCPCVEINGLLIFRCLTLDYQTLIIVIRVEEEGVSCDTPSPGYLSGCDSKMLPYIDYC